MAVVLIGTNRHTGKIVAVGMYPTINDARPYVARNGGRDVLYSVWTPDMNETIEVPAITGLSLAASVRG